MSDFIHERRLLKVNTKVRCEADRPCNVLLLDDANFRLYKEGKRYKHFGGHLTRFPAEILVPRTGPWNVVVDLGGETGQIALGLTYIEKK